MMKLAWKPGALGEVPGPLLISATRFTYRSLWVMPAVFREGLLLRRHWTDFEGGLGVSLSGDLLKRTTYTVSAWRSEEDLRNFVRSAAHMRLMRRYRAQMESSAFTTWTTDRFSLREAWREAARRLDGQPRSISMASPYEKNR
jgi:hypothetical protein